VSNTLCSNDNFRVFLSFHRILKKKENCLNANIYSYLKTSGGQSSNLHLIVVHFSTLALNWHLWQLKTLVLVHWRQIHAVLLVKNWLLFQQ